MKLILLVSLAMIAFAGNSVLTRLALTNGTIDAGSFTILRILCGALVLYGLIVWRHKRTASSPATLSSPSLARRGAWSSAFSLFAYAALFSFAYLEMDTGIGALVLFTCVQITMVGWGLYSGERPRLLEWVGMALAFLAFTQLVAPIPAFQAQSAEFSPPPLIATIAMALSGIAWGIYSLKGRSAPDALADTAGNFLKAAILAVPFGAILLASNVSMNITQGGLVLAAICGAVTSAIGYAIWYACLPQFSATKAAIVQLSAPTLATIGGILIVGESIDARFLICAALILGGIAMSTLAKSARVK